MMMTDDIKIKLEKAVAFAIEKSAAETVSGTYYMYPEDIPADIIAPDLLLKHADDFVNIMREYEAIADADVDIDGVIDITLYLDYCPNYEPLPQEKDAYPPGREILDPLKSRLIPEPEKPTHATPPPKPTLAERLAKNKDKAAAQEKPAANKSKEQENSI